MYMYILVITGYSYRWFTMWTSFFYLLQRLLLHLYYFFAHNHEWRRRYMYMYMLAITYRWFTMWTSFFYLLQLLTVPRNKMWIASECKGSLCISECIQFEHNLNTDESKWNEKETQKIQGHQGNAAGTKVKRPYPLNKQLVRRRYVSTFSVISGDYCAGVDYNNLNKECPCHGSHRVKLSFAFSNKAIKVTKDLGTKDPGNIAVILGLAVSAGHNIGEDGQEERGGSEEDEAGEGVMTVALAIGAHGDYDPSQHDIG